MTRLGDLFPEAPAEAAGQAVTGLTADSRKVVPGGVFVAVPGTTADGRLFAAKAAQAGALAVAGEGARPADLPEATAWIAVPDARRALALAAARLSGRQPETVLAVTGTAGKSSVADFIRQIFSAMGRESASLGTVGIVTNRGRSTARSPPQIPSPCTRPWPGWRVRASPNSRWRPPPTGSSSAASTGCA